MFKSIRWKFIIIYFMLVFIAMIIAGVFIIQSIQEYHFSNVTKELSEISELVLPKLERYDDLASSQDKIEEIIVGVQGVGINKEIYVIDRSNSSIIATTTENVGISADEVLELDLLLSGLNGRSSESIESIQSGSVIFRTKDMIFPVIHTGKVTGALYLRSDLREIFDTLNKSIIIIIQSIVLSSGFTILLGFFIARTITDPINDVTMRVAKLAQGDFNQVVQVRSDDEIGQLADTFNYLTGRLNTSMREISREKSKLETIINHMDDGLIAADRNGEIIHINPKARGILKIDEHERDFNEIALRIDRSLVLDNLMFNNPDWTGSLTEQIENSYIKISFAPYTNDEGDKNGFVFLIQDITEAQRLEDMRREFVANVSHELKTPLTSIKSYTETILDGMIDDKEMTQQFLSVVNSEADRMTRLVRDLLQLSNFDARKVDLEFEYHDYVTLLKKAIMKVEVTAKSKNQQIKFIADVDEVVGYFDYDRIEQVMLNILSNAIKYTPENGRIKAFITQLDDHVQIRVDDTGIGISKKHLARIFDRFYRVDKARSRNMGGTGLGLSIAKEIVELHQGEIEIDSKVGSGTSILVRIPMKMDMDQT
ncbi:ATP-binding protein [Fusibacter sp. JL216-2]|uniref:sensor histidine kinase n=1 Tax=Fusibacter sp. JL216-2 TaxID=3071453 RepID=UPI003D3469E7